MAFAGKWVALLELFGYGDAGRLIGPRANQAPGARITILPAMEYMATPQLSMALGLEIDLAGKNANANYTPVSHCFTAFNPRLGPGPRAGLATVFIQESAWSPGPAPPV